MANVAIAASSGSRLQPLLVWSHGRSGSTVFLDALGSDPALWPIYEPLQEVRERPPLHFHIQENQVGRCRDARKEALVSVCPLRDALLLHSALSCNLMPLLTAWYAELELAHGKAAFMPHGSVHGSGFTTTKYTDRIHHSRSVDMLEKQKQCTSRFGTVAKVIRMNGMLDAVHNVTLTLGFPPPLIIHIIRDARAVYASRKRLLPIREAASFQVSDSSRLHDERQAREWAHKHCSATQRDVAFGQSQMQGSYFLVNYSTFARRPREIIERLYTRYLRRPVPQAVYAYLQEHLHVLHHMPPPGAATATNQSWQYMFGTSARDANHVDRQWMSELAPWEARAIDEQCAPNPSPGSPHRHRHAKPQGAVGLVKDRMGGRETHLARRGHLRAYTFT